MAYTHYFSCAIIISPRNCLKVVWGFFTATSQGILVFNRESCKICIHRSVSLLNLLQTPFLFLPHSVLLLLSQVKLREPSSNTSITSPDLSSPPQKLWMYPLHLCLSLQRAEQSLHCPVPVPLGFIRHGLPCKPSSGLAGDLSAAALVSPIVISCYSSQ